MPKGKPKQLVPPGRPKKIVTEVRRMSDDEIKQILPRKIYEGLLISVETMVGFLRSKDLQKKYRASAFMLDKLGDSKFWDTLKEMTSQARKLGGEKVEWGD